jgi:aspartate/methionine/tyrosine aminotransferase
MAIGLALAAMIQVSALTTIFVTKLLKSPKLSDIISLNSERLQSAYQCLTKFLKEHDIPYIPCNAGLYVFAKLAPNAQTWDDEALVVKSFKESGVIISPGKAYHGPESEKGWMRVGFAMEPSVMEEAISRMREVLSGNNAHNTQP